MEEVEVKRFRRIAEKAIRNVLYCRVLPMIEAGLMERITIKTFAKNEETVSADESPKIPYPIGNIVEYIKDLQNILEKVVTEREGDDRPLWKLASSGIRGGILALGDKMTPEEMVDKMTDLYQRKNSDYGNAFVKSMGKFGVIVSAIRIGDKVNRLDSLCEKYRPKDEDAIPHPLVEDESMGDTFIDLACYAIMTIMWLNQKIGTEV